MDPQPRTPLDLSAIVTPSAQVLAQELDGEAVLLNLESERYFGLDDVGTRVWRHLLEHRRLARVCKEMQKEYDVDESTLREDVLRLVAELLEAGIVTVEQDATSDRDEP
jgi:predicted transcriptional regulator